VQFRRANSPVSDGHWRRAPSNDRQYRERQEMLRLSLPLKQINITILKPLNNLFLRLIGAIFFFLIYRLEAAELRLGQ
jgi:hypothetical protein